MNKFALSRDYYEISFKDPGYIIFRGELHVALSVDSMKHL